MRKQGIVLVLLTSALDLRGDIMRTLNVYHFLRFTPAGREVMRLLPTRDEHIKMFVNAGQRKDHEFTVYLVPFSLLSLSNIVTG